MGIFRYPIKIAASPAGPFEALDAIVDSGAAYTQAPRSLLERLGVGPIDRATFVLANGQAIECDIGEAAIRIDGRTRTNVVVFGEEGTEPLLGAITLESFLLAPDPVNRRLTPVRGYLLAATASAIREALDAIVNQRRDLSEEEAAAVMEEIMTGQATPAQLGAFLVALRLKGETIDEIAGMARVMRQHALHIPTDGEALLDTCGTGGDASGSFNVSTAAAFVAAAAGARVAKHGNRAMSSGCGSADVLEALGARIDLTPEQVGACLRQVGLGFMFAPVFHPAMKHAAGPRRELGVRTVFNILGPLTNPAGARHQLLGVADAALGEKMALVMARLGSRHALVVHGQGLDELSLAGPSLVFELRDGQIRRYSVAPEAVGLTTAPVEAVRGGSPADNAAALRAIFQGKAGPLRDIVILNAAAALVAADLAPDLQAGVQLAAQAIDSGAANRKLERFVELSNSFPEPSKP